MIYDRKTRQSIQETSQTTPNSLYNLRALRAPITGAPPFRSDALIAIKTCLTILTILAYGPTLSFHPISLVCLHTG